MTVDCKQSISRFFFFFVCFFFFLLLQWTVYSQFHVFGYLQLTVNSQFHVFFFFFFFFFFFVCLPLTVNSHFVKRKINTDDGVKFSIKTLKTGPSCSKLTTSLVNDSLKFTSSDTQIC